MKNCSCLEKTNEKKGTETSVLLSMRKREREDRLDLQSKEFLKLFSPSMKTILDFRKKEIQREQDLLA